jgi:hypothetical protein
VTSSTPSCRALPYLEEVKHRFPDTRTLIITKLFDPQTEAEEAQFPNFIQKQPCAWGGKRFDELPAELQKQMLATELAVEFIETGEADEARDLFIRLQAGMPLNPQEKRDAWPGNFTEYILKLGLLCPVEFTRLLAVDDHSFEREPLRELRPHLPVELCVVPTRLQNPRGFAHGFISTVSGSRLESWIHILDDTLRIGEYHTVSYLLDNPRKQGEGFGCLGALCGITQHHDCPGFCFVDRQRLRPTRSSR